MHSDEFVEYTRANTDIASRSFPRPPGSFNTTSRLSPRPQDLVNEVLTVFEALGLVCMVISKVMVTNRQAAYCLYITMVKLQDQSKQQVGGVVNTQGYLCRFWIKGLVLNNFNLGPVYLVKSSREYADNFKTFFG